MSFGKRIFIHCISESGNFLHSWKKKTKSWFICTRVLSTRIYAESFREKTFFSDLSDSQIFFYSLPPSPAKKKSTKVCLWIALQKFYDSTATAWTFQIDPVPFLILSAVFPSLWVRSIVCLSFLYNWMSRCLDKVRAYWKSATFVQKWKTLRS